jgi:DNA repair protein RadC
VILVHNHPSGNLGASDYDKKSTKDVNELFKLIGCRIVDHI